jgi:hypothetical protein
VPRLSVEGAAYTTLFARIRRLAPLALALVAIAVAACGSNSSSSSSSSSTPASTSSSSSGAAATTSASGGSSNGIPQGPTAGDADADNQGAPSDGDGNV